VDMKYTPTMRECLGRNASNCGDLRSLAKREGWSVEVLEMERDRRCFAKPSSPAGARSRR
jgi:hypothetical protein